MAKHNIAGGWETENAGCDTPQSAPSRRLSQRDLATHWQISERTLERERWMNTGPAYIKVGGRVVYRLEDVVAYEMAQLRQAGARWTTSWLPTRVLVGLVP